MLDPKFNPSTLSKIQQIYLVSSLRKHPFLLALRRWGRFARRNVVPPHETSPAVTSVEKQMLSQATWSLTCTNMTCTKSSVSHYFLSGNSSKVAQARRASALLHNIRNIRIFMGKKNIVSVTLRK